MKISERGIQFIKDREGLRLAAYQDSGGVWTIGWGHTGIEVKAGMVIGRVKAEKLLKEDIEKAERAIEKYVDTFLFQSQYDALCSFILNIGESAFAHSTMRRKLNAGDYNGAADQFDRWVYDGKEKVEGLVNRRKMEKEMFLMMPEEEEVEVVEEKMVEEKEVKAEAEVEVIVKEKKSWLSILFSSFMTLFR